MLFDKYPKYKFAFIAIDICVLTVSFFIANKELVDVSLPLDIFIFCTFMFVQLFFLYFNDLYQKNRIEVGVEQAWVLVKSLLWGCGAVIIILFLVSNSKIIHMRNFILKLYLFCLFFSLFFRVFVGKEILLYLGRKKIFTNKILIVGDGKAAIKAAKAFTYSPSSHFKLCGFVGECHTVSETVFENFACLGPLENITQIVNEYKIDEILIAKDNIDYSTLIETVRHCEKTGVSVHITSKFLNIVAEKLQVERFETIPVIVLDQHQGTRLTTHLKRSFDIATSSAAILLFSPLFLFIALGIKLSSKGPVIFKQQRIGMNGKPFDFYKFRSMHIDPNDNRHKNFIKSFIAADQDKPTEKRREKSDLRIFKIKDDPRIFPLGKFIRKTSIDEFPQFFNVLKGDMSLVGPRPCPTYEWDFYDDWHKKRLNILPGCTGIWQAMGRSTVSFEEMVLLDLYYVNNASLLLDLKILLKTIPVILLGRGGY